MRLRLERRAEPLAGVRVTAALLAGSVLCGLLLGAVLIMPFGVDPLEGFRSLAIGGFLGLRGIGYALVAATTLMLVGFGTIVAWSCGFVFLGFEGCLLIGAMGGTWVGLAALPGGALSGLAPPLVILMALAWGTFLAALWAGIVGEMKVRLGGNEVLIALMMNFLAIYLVQYLVAGPWRVPGDMPQTARLPQEVWLPVILPGSRLHAGLLFAIAAGAAVWLLMARSRAGFEMIASGLNPRAALYGGIAVGGRQRQSALIAGGLAGLAGAIVILGVHHRLLDGLSDGSGFAGIVVALLGRMTVPGTIIAAILFGGLNVGADAMQRQTGLPSSIVLIVQASIVLMLLAAEILRTHRPSLAPSPQRER